MDFMFHYSSYIFVMAMHLCKKIFDFSVGLGVREKKRNAGMNLRIRFLMVAAIFASILKHQLNIIVNNYIIDHLGNCAWIIFGTICCSHEV